jgi:UDP-glucose 4-epimerase
VVRDFIYVGDLIAALLKALTYTGEQRIFNVGSGQGRSLNELLAAIEALLGRKVRCTYTPSRSFDVPSNVLDVSLASQYLDWRPQTTFQDGLRRTLAWIVAHGMS